MFFSNVLDIFVELISIHANVGKHRPSCPVQCAWLDFLLSLRTWNCVDLDLKFSFLILHVLLYVSVKGGTSSEASLPSEQFLSLELRKITLL